MINLLSIFGVACTPGGSFFGFPTWYKYLDGQTASSSAIVDPRINVNTCSPVITGLSDVWLVGAAVLEILLRIAAMLAIGLIVYGGIRYIVSQGEPDKLASARSTIINALIGLVVAIAASAVVSFVAREVIK